jgi:hypothetical protein
MTLPCSTEILKAESHYRTEQLHIGNLLTLIFVNPAPAMQYVQIKLKSVLVMFGKPEFVRSVERPLSLRKWRGSHYSLARRRQNGNGELPNVMQGLQPPQGGEVM